MGRTLLTCIAKFSTLRFSPLCVCVCIIEMTITNDLPCWPLEGHQDVLRVCRVSIALVNVPGPS